MRPHWIHDCNVVGMNLPEREGGWVAEVGENACTFIGTLIKENDQVYDLYVHVRDYDEGNTFVETVARFSDEGPDYLSGPSAVKLVREFLMQNYYDPEELKKELPL